MHRVGCAHMAHLLVALRSIGQVEPLPGVQAGNAPPPHPLPPRPPPAVHLRRQTQELIRFLQKSPDTFSGTEVKTPPPPSPPLPLPDANHAFSSFCSSFRLFLVGSCFFHCFLFHLLWSPRGEACGVRACGVETRVPQAVIFLMLHACCGRGAPNFLKPF